MVTIKCTVYEKHDLLRLLDYAKEKKIQECDEGKITTKLLQMYIDRIELLKRRVKGQYREDYHDVATKSYRRQYKRSDDDLDPYKEWQETLY